MARQREREATARYNARRQRHGVRPSRRIWTPSWSVLTGWGWLLIGGAVVVVASVVVALVYLVW